MDFIFLDPGFDWDEHNIHKNWIRHQVKHTEAEEVFFNLKFKVLPDPTHSALEKRFIALGQTSEGRPLFVVFTERRKKIRVISARNMSKKEREMYEKTQKGSKN